MTPRGVDVAAEDLAVEAEGDHALLDARAAGVVEPDDRAADLHGEVHDLDDLLAEDLAERAAEDGEVLGEDRDLAAVDRAVAGDDAVAVGPVLLLAERVAAVPGVLVHLDERALVEQHLEALAGGLLAAGVLLLDGALRPGVGDLGHPALEVGQLARGGRGCRGRSGTSVRTVTTGSGCSGHAGEPSLAVVARIARRRGPCVRRWSRRSPWQDLEHPRRRIGSTNARAGAGWARPWRVVVADHQRRAAAGSARTWEAPPGTSVAVVGAVPRRRPTAPAGCRCSPGSRWPRRFARSPTGAGRRAQVAERRARSPTTATARSAASSASSSRPGGRVVVVGAGHQRRPDPRASSRRHRDLPGARGSAGGAPGAARRRLPRPPRARWHADLMTGRRSAGAGRARHTASACRTVGRTVDAAAGRTARTPRATAVAVDDDGRLVVRRADGRHAVGGRRRHPRPSGGG